ncbi:MAG: hypothetical protein Q7T82_08380 [Armatimonadota bacterium]|nr:hypothetical protein [Armatimonadota bacterium]
MRWERTNRAERPGFTENDFKICEFCGALNVASSIECVICGWHGRFDYDPESVKRAMESLRTAIGQETLVSDDINLEEYLVRARRPNRALDWIKRVLGLNRDLDG